MYKYVLLLLMFLPYSYSWSCDLTATLNVHNDSINYDEYQNKCIVLAYLKNAITNNCFACSQADNTIDTLRHAGLTCIDLNDPIDIANLGASKKDGIKKFLRNLQYTHVEVVDLNGSGITPRSLFHKNSPDYYIKIFTQDMETLKNIQGRKIYVYFEGDPMPSHSPSSDESGDEITVDY